MDEDLSSIFDAAERKLAISLNGTKTSFDNQCDNAQRVIENMAAATLVAGAPAALERATNPTDSPAEGAT